jgi:hypothetical protein
MKQVSPFEGYFSLGLHMIQLDEMIREANGEPPMTSEEYAAKVSDAFEVANGAATTVTLALADLADRDRRRRRGLFGWLFG